MKVTITEALVRRKELKMRTDMFTKIAAQNVFEPRIRRQLVSDAQGIEQVDGSIPKTTKEMVEREAAYYSKCWRLVDSAIQQANHTVKCDVPASVMQDFVTNAAVPEGDIEVTLAELLVQRKLLQEKVSEALLRVDLGAFMTTVSTRKTVAAGIEDLLAAEKVPAHTLVAKQLHYLTQLRLCEGLVTRANIETKLDIRDEVFQDYK
jgi:hypothetical protein